MRIRSVKPEFWTDETVVECSIPARLLFIGTWNISDDSGNLDRSSKQLKMKIFPADVIDCEPLVQELIAHGLLEEYTIDGKIYLHIKGFNKHQVINKPSKSKIPPYSSGSTTVALPEHYATEGKGIGEGKEEEEKESPKQDNTPSPSLSDSNQPSSDPEFTKLPVFIVPNTPTAQAYNDFVFGRNKKTPKPTARASPKKRNLAKLTGHTGGIDSDQI